MDIALCCWTKKLHLPIILSMKISDFSKKSKLPVNTIRYYMRLGLLKPDKRASAYEFSDSCLEDAKRIRQYKAYGFSLKCIAQLIELEREPSADKDSLRDLCQLKASQVKLDLEKTRQDVLEAIHQLELQLEQTIKMDKSTVNAIPMELFLLIECPYCNKSLAWQDISLITNTVISGRGDCACGFSADIHNGVLTASNVNQVILPVLDKNLDTNRRMDAQEVSQKSMRNRWIINKLKATKLEEKVVFEDVPNVSSFLLECIEELPAEAYYIISDTDPSVIHRIMRVIRAKAPGHKILFLVDDGIHHPIRKASIDCLLDYHASEIFRKYGYQSQLSEIKAYLAEEAHLIGVFTYLVKANPQRLAEQNTRYDLKQYKLALAEQGINILDADPNTYVSDASYFADNDYKNERFSYFVFSGLLEKS